MSRVEPLVLRAGTRKSWGSGCGLRRPAGLAQRGRTLVLAAEGNSYAEVARLVGMSPPTVRVWREHYATGGLAQLDDRPRSGRPTVYDEQMIIAATLDRPPENLGVTRWSARLRADHLGISFATVARVWRRWGLKPSKS